MSSSDTIDPQQLHRQQSVALFNRAWDLLDRGERTPAEDEAMFLAACASLWHWNQRDDVTARHRSIGCWQISRVQAMLNRGADSMHWARRSLEEAIAAGSDPFYTGYAHEAVARAAGILGKTELMRRHQTTARDMAAGVADEGLRKALQDDLNTVKARKPL
ncbi:MAG: hypothetical protein KGO50_05900 [Myxococcales bacterium]|nr:hypothetical protein [Myxococcales bacterium]